MRIPDLLHVTVLKVGKELVAAHLGVQDKEKLYLGVFAHSPFWAKHSPGKLHLLMLGEQLAKQGYSALDMTPGGPWKERFATAHEDVHVLTVFFNRGQLIKHKIRQNFEASSKLGLRLVGLTPKTARSFLTKLPRVRMTNLWVRLLRKVWHKSEFQVYIFKAHNVPKLECPKIMRKNCLEDLLAFQPPEAWQTRQEFLARSLSYLEKGYHVYTYVEQGCLLHYGWLIEQQEKAFCSEVDQELKYLPASAVLFDCYTHPTARGRGLHQFSLRQRLHDAAAIPGIKQIYVSVLSNNRPSRHVIEKVGFTYKCSLFRKLRFRRVNHCSAKQNTEAGSEAKRFKQWALVLSRRFFI